MVGVLSLLQEGLARHRSGELAEASALYAQILHIEPGHADAHYYLGMIACQQGRFDEGVGHARQALAAHPTHVLCHVLLGRALSALGNKHEALTSFDQALTLAPEMASVHGHRGDLLADIGRYDDAVASYDRALSLNAADAENWLNRGATLSALKRTREAIGSFERAISCKPDLIEAHLRHAKALSDVDRDREALESADRAVGFMPGAAKAWLGRGNILLKLKHYDDAFASFDRALSLDSRLGGAWVGRGNGLTALRRYADAFTAYDHALATSPDLAEAWLGRGNILFLTRRYAEALSAYGRALDVNPNLVPALEGRATVLDRLKRHREAAAAYAEALRVDPTRPFLKGLLLHQEMLACDWSSFEARIAEIEDDIRSGKPSGYPFGWQAVASSPRSLQLCAELFNERRFPTAPTPKYAGRPPNAGQKIRIGYSSGEFREQATSHLIVGMLEAHDRSRFEVYAIDNGWDDKSQIRQRINGAVTEVVDISELGDETAAAAIIERGIDILINLNGYFGEERTAVFARRPAPIQVNYLGFPGTLGASYIDYLIADRVVIPPGHEQFYNEKIVFLPDSYQANDRHRPIAETALTRVDCGLPDDNFVFCCFNNNYKIVPVVFDSWMRVLRRVENSVLWLIHDNADAASNLRDEARARGIDPRRLIFAERLLPAHHLARQTLADLFLDTLPYNAHTTASDALWAGLPVLTQIGDTFPGKVAASLLYALDLPELITHSRPDYEARAIELATESKKLAEIKEKISKNRLTTALFDTERFTRCLETAYVAMHERYRARLAPDQMDLSTQAIPRASS